MKPDHIFIALTVASFIASCTFYRKAHDVAGDRLLFLAHTMLLSGWLAMFERWGVLIRN